MRKITLVLAFFITKNAFCQSTFEKGEHSVYYNENGDAFKIDVRVKETFSLPVEKINFVLEEMEYYLYKKEKVFYLYDYKENMELYILLQSNDTVQYRCNDFVYKYVGSYKKIKLKNVKELFYIKSIYLKCLSVDYTNNVKGVILKIKNLKNEVQTFYYSINCGE